MKVLNIVWSLALVIGAMGSAQRFTMIESLMRRTLSSSSFPAPMVPGTDYQGRISFGIRNLSGQGRYVVAVDRAEKVLLEQGHIRIHLCWTLRA